MNIHQLIAAALAGMEPPTFDLRKVPTYAAKFVQEFPASINIDEDEKMSLDAATAEIQDYVDYSGESLVTVRNALAKAYCDRYGIFYGSLL